MPVPSGLRPRAVLMLAVKRGESGSVLRRERERNALLRALVSGNGPLGASASLSDSSPSLKSQSSWLEVSTLRRPRRWMGCVGIGRKNSPSSRAELSSGSVNSSCGRTGFGGGLGKSSGEGSLEDIVFD